MFHVLPVASRRVTRSLFPSISLCNSLLLIALSDAILALFLFNS